LFTVMASMFSGTVAVAGDRGDVGTVSGGVRGAAVAAIAGEVLVDWEGTGGVGGSLDGFA
jgi:hypothetical protein